MQHPAIVFISGLVILGLLFWYLASDLERSKRNIGSFLIAAIIGLCVWALLPQAPEDGQKAEGRLKPGIDLAGGSSFTVQVQPKISLTPEAKDEEGEEGEEGETGPDITAVTPEAVQQAIKTLQGRLNPQSNRDMLIQPQGEDRIIIEMPGVTEEEAAWVRSQITKTAVLELRKVHPKYRTLAPLVAKGEIIEPGYQHYLYKYVDDEGVGQQEDLLLSKRNDIKGKHVKQAWPDSARAGVINVTLTPTGGKYMRKLTSGMEKGVDRLAIVLDGEVKSAPVVQDILSSQFVIQGIDDNEERKNLSSTLMNPLENPLIIEEERSVTARLGAATVKQGIYAGMAGIGLTLIFLLIYYRIAGIIALLGLTVTTLILFGSMAMFEFTFTLPGIAGIILTIGVAVDANVLIYERLREELQSGKSVRAAIQAAYEKAFSAIFDANITTLITAIILFWRASGTVKGFAITLTIGILASMFAALVATRVFFWWGADGNIIRKLKFVNLIPDKTIDFLSKRRLALVISGVLLVASLLVVGVKRESALGIDFAGGTLVRFQTEQEIVPESEVQSILQGLSLQKIPIVQNESEPPPSNANILSIRCAYEDSDTIVNALREQIPLLGAKAEAEAGAPAAPTVDPVTGAQLEEPWKYSASRDTVKASLGGDFLVNSLLALGIGLVGILLYITVRFEFSFAVGAFAALFHDLIITIGIVIAFGHELSLIHVGAFLTILGYSINDTIVVFDRIRETLRLKRGDTEKVMDLAINATLSRTVLTSATTFVAVLVLYIFGGPALQAFAFAIMIGVVVGTYSSIFVAAPIVLVWSRMRGTNLRRELLDADLEAQVNPARG